MNSTWHLGDGPLGTVHLLGDVGEEHAIVYPPSIASRAAEYRWSARLPSREWKDGAANSLEEAKVSVEALLRPIENNVTD